MNCSSIKNDKQNSIGLSKLWILLLFCWWITSFRVPPPPWASFIPMVGHYRHLSASLGSSHPCLSGASRVLLALSSGAFWPQINLITAFAISSEQLTKNCHGYGISVTPSHRLVFHWARYYSAVCLRVWSVFSPSLPPVSQVWSLPSPGYLVIICFSPTLEEQVFHFLLLSSMLISL